MLLGGVICTQKRALTLQDALATVRRRFNLSREMRWTKVSKQYFDAYKAWVDVFFDDPYTRFYLLAVDKSELDWQSFIPSITQKPTRDDKLASVFYQFLLISFGPLRDTKRWWMYPDSGFFSKDKVLDRVEFLFNYTYKKAFGPKTSRIIRMARAQDSKNENLIQLADVLLGAISCNVTGLVPASTARGPLVEYCCNKCRATPTTERGLEKVSVHAWKHPDKFTYPR